MAYAKRSDGRYVSKVTLNDGTKKYLYAYSVTELKQKEMELRQKVDKGFDVLKQTDSLNKWAERTFESKKRHLNPKAYKVYCSRVNYFLDEIGFAPIIEIRKSHIEPLISSLAIENPCTHTPTSKKTQIYYLSALSDVFEFAISDRVIEYNPCKYIKIDQDAPKSNRRSLSTEEQERIINTDHPFKLPVMIAMCAGLRRGEITCLQWSDIDLNNKVISVTKAFDFDTLQLKGPKTEAGYRVVPIPDILFNYLLTVPKTSMLVVPNKNGQMLTDSQWKRSMEKYIAFLDSKYCKTVDNQFTHKETTYHIDRFGMHDLRHTFCTNILNSKCPINLVQKIMGHSDISTTLNIYGHLDVDEVKKVGAEFSTYLNQKMAGK